MRLPPTRPPHRPAHTKLHVCHHVSLIQLLSSYWLVSHRLFSAQYGFLSSQRAPGAHTPSVLLGLWRIILPLAGVPEEQGDTDGGQSHHPEGSPVQLEKRGGEVRELGRS